MLVSYVAFWVISLVLIGSGAAKLTQPEPFAHFIADATGRAVGAGVARAVAVAEIGVGLAGLVLAGRAVALLLTLLYVVFSIVVAAAMSSGAATCGCFGAASTRPRVAHLVMNLLSAVVALGAVVRVVPAMADGIAGRGTGAVAAVGAVLLGAAGVIFVDTR